MTTALRDAAARPLRKLRVSVTDRCNLRCAYCMPEEDYTWFEKRQVLTFEETAAIVDRFLSLGVDQVRLTGGEPLVRCELPTLVRLLGERPGIRDLSLTTNGVLLAPLASALRAAGLSRLNVSLDTLTPSIFRSLTRRDALDDVLAGIAAAAATGFPRGLKLDTVVIRGVNDHELVPLLDFAATQGAELRFIEYMDVGGATRWSRAQVVSRAELLATLAAKLGPIEALAEPRTAPAERFRLVDGRVFGVIASTTQPFCNGCDRSRLTADGTWFTCLYADAGLDLKTPLRRGEEPASLEALIRATWRRRSDRGAELRQDLGEARGPLASPPRLRSNPQLEMHTRGG